MADETWIPAATAASLLRTPLGVVVRDIPLVLFRAADGRPRALLDRCPHRGVPLSMGRCERDRLVCAYHGWAFDGDGRCVRIPSNLDPEGPPLPRAMATTYPAEERDGQVWVRLP